MAIDEIPIEESKPNQKLTRNDYKKHLSLFNQPKSESIYVHALSANAETMREDSSSPIKMKDVDSDKRMCGVIID